MYRYAFVPALPAPSHLRRNFARASPAIARRVRNATTCTLRAPPPISKAIPAVCYAAYMTHLFLLSPTGPPTPVASLGEALQLSLNFLYITPLAFPSLAPALHPMVEAIFHIVVAWAVLLLAFSAEDVRDQSEPDAVPAAPFLLAALLLTNIFYLPYLALRTPPTSSLREVPAAKRTGLLRAAESPALPAFGLFMVLVSVPWALFARPEFGDLATRISSFGTIVDSDILAHSFGVDVLVFTVFQAWLVRDDARRRAWTGGSYDAVARAATFVPFFGLVVYLFERARRAPVRWVEVEVKEEDVQ